MRTIVIINGMTDDILILETNRNKEDIERRMKQEYFIIHNDESIIYDSEINDSYIDLDNYEEIYDINL